MLHRFRNAPGAPPVLIAATDNYGILAVARALRAAGYTPWLAVHKPGTYAARSSAVAGTVPVPDPSFDPKGFVPELAVAAARLSAAAVLPSGENHLLALADREADFAGIAFGVPSRESVNRATHKGLLSTLGTAAGLRTPPTAKVVRGDTEAVGAFDFPAILKPLYSLVRNPDGTMLGYSVRHVTVEQAEEAVKGLPERGGLVQPYIPGQLISVSGVSWEGEIVCALHQLSIRTWPMHVGGSSYAVTIQSDEELERGVGRLLGELGWSGIFQVQFVRDPGGEHYLIDINPRVYGTLGLATAAGLNLPGIWTDLLLGKSPRVDGYRIGVRFRHEEKDIRALIRLLLVGDGERWGALQGFLPRRKTAHAIFALHDPMPLLTSAAKLLKSSSAERADPQASRKTRQSW